MLKPKKGSDYSLPFFFLIWWKYVSGPKKTAYNLGYINTSNLRKFEIKYDAFLNKIR